MSGEFSTQTYNNSSYAVLPKMNWHDAQAQAQAMGGSLVTINDAAEEQWLQQTFGDKTFWTGFNDDAQEGNWQWVSGEAVTYTNWLKNKPDNKNGNENFAIMGAGKTEQWNDNNGSLLRRSIVEIKLDPIFPADESDDSISDSVENGNNDIEIDNLPSDDSNAAIASDNSSSNVGTGLKFNFTYEADDQGTSKASQKQMVAFEIAGQIWSQYLNDDATINIHIDITDDLPDGVIGGAIPGFVAEEYTTVRDNLTKDQSSEEDATAIGKLDSSELDTTVSVFRSESSGIEMKSANPFISPTRANLKAIGSSQVLRDDTALDGYILMNDLTNAPVTWHYDEYGVTGQNQDLLHDDEIDFLSVAIHEIGHLLGFVSGVDYQQSDWTRLYNTNDRDERLEIVQERTGVASMLDLFRYDSASVQTEDEIEARREELQEKKYLSNNPNALISLTSNKNELSIGGNPFFSIVNGVEGENAFLQFANGRLDDSSVAQQIWGGLDNFQASHWTQDTDSIMVPAIAPGQRNAISDTELIAFDVLGYDRTSGFSLPDYASLYQAAQEVVAQYDSSRTSQSRLDDVLAMIDASSMYEGRGSRRTTRRQELLDVFAQEALFSSFDMDEWQSYVESVTVKEAGTAEADVMKGSIGGDRLRGMGDADILKGYEGDDLLRGNQEGDRILGGTGNDTLIGGNGDDILKGESGDDLLKGGAGIDVMVGGEGTDTFVIDITAGFNVIRDFVVGEDQLSLAGGMEISLGQRNNHTTITLANDEDRLLAVLRNVASETVILS